jgi:peptide/nickel transport system substrate-binding protein
MRRPRQDESHLRVGLEWEVDILDAPSSFGGWNTGRMAQQVFEGLVEDDLRTPGQSVTSIVPALAERWRISADGRTYSFELRKGVRFHDGEPFTAESVDFNLRRCWDRSHPFFYPVAADYNRVALQSLQRIKILNSHAIQLELAEPFPEFLRYLTQEDGPGSAVFVSPKSIAKYGNEDVGDRCAGTGPFEFDKRISTEHGSAVSLVANRRYWGDGAKLDRLSFLPIPNAVDRVRALQGGHVDVIYGPDPRLLTELTSTGFTVCSGPIPYVWYFIFNMREPPFDDIRIRRAIFHGFDRERMCAELFSNNICAPRGIVPPASPSFDNDFPNCYAFDPDRARSLVREVVGRGVLKSKLLTVTGGSAQLAPVEICEWLQRDLNGIGISLELERRHDWVSYCNEWRMGIPKGVGISQNSWGMSCDLWLEHVAHSKNISPRAFNVGYYGRAEIDRILDCARVEIDDNERRELYRIAHRKIMNDAPLLPVANIAAGAVAHAPFVTGFTYSPQNWHDLSGVSLDAT